MASKGLPGAAVFHISSELLASETAVRALEDVDAVIAVLVLERSEDLVRHGDPQKVVLCSTAERSSLQTATSA
jgi:hypothetical protein